MDGLDYRIEGEMVRVSCAGVMSFPRIETLYLRMFAEPAHRLQLLALVDLRGVTNFPTVDDMFRMRTLMAELYGDKLASRRVAMVSTDAGAEQLLKLYKEVYVLRGGGSGGTFRLFTDPVPAEAWLKEPPAA